MAEIEKEILVEYLTNIIIDIRNNSKNFLELNKNLNELKNFENLLDNNDNVEYLFNTYKNLQKISLQLRKQLSQFIDLEVYDKITYSFYYDGKRYETDEIKKEWLSKSSSGDLKINLKKATDDLSSAYSEEYKKQIKNAFDKHFEVFQNAITGTYNGIIGRKGAINKGHLAEAYESHTKEHHPQHYRLLNHMLTSVTIVEPLPQLISYTKDAAIDYWANHEGITQAWEHIRESLGTQRGTVAGDVDEMQVKATGPNARRLRLARLNTLIKGVEIYSDLLNLNKSPREVAIQIADYMSEPVRKVSERIIEEVGDEVVKNSFKTYNDSITLRALIRI